MTASLPSLPLFHDLQWDVRTSSICGRRLTPLSDAPDPINIGASDTEHLDCLIVH
jgi:hypothetical protein